MKYIEYIDRQAALNRLCIIASDRGLSANDLIEGFIDKGSFSKMRNGKAKKIPLDLIIFLAKELGENVEDILRETSPTDPDFFEAIDSIQYYNKIRQYDASKYLLIKLKEQFKDEIEKSIEICQIVEWSEGIINFEINKDPFFAIDIFNNALSLNDKSFDIKDFTAHNYSEIEIGIINAILICYFKIDKTNSDIKLAYEKLIEFLESKHINDYEIAVNVYYEYYRVCSKQNVDTTKLLDIALETADLALENGITNKLPFIYYQIALIYTDLENKENMEQYFNSAIFLYKQIGVPADYLNKIISNREECRKMLKKSKKKQSTNTKEK